MSRKRLDGKVALVSGSGFRGSLLGTGRATAILFAREGALDQALNAGKPAVVDVKTNVEGIGDRAWMPK